MSRLSIRARLTAWYAGVTLVALAVMAVAVLALVGHSVTLAADDRLVAHHAGLARFANGLESGLTLAEARDEYREYADMSLGNALFEVTDAAGESLARPDAPDWERAVESLRADAAQRITRAADMTIAGQPYRASTQPLTIKGAPARAVIAVPMGPVDAALDRAERLLFWLLPLVALVAGGCGFLVSGRALRPVDRLTQAAQQINLENLHERLEVPPATDELQRLAVTFNSMLDRLESGVANMARFTSEASHELRTPVTRVRTAAELALRRERSVPDYQQALAEIHAQSREMSALVDDLLAMARADAGVEAPPDTVIDARALVEGFAASWHLLPPLALGGEAAALFVRAEPRHLRRVLAIVCENAAKYGARDQPIRLVARATDTDVVLEIEDDGPGVDAADLPHVFDRFYRGRRARAGEESGSGLGLAIAKSIVERHGGTMTMASPIHPAAERPGARVTITLPRVAAPQEPA